VTSASFLLLGVTTVFLAFSLDGSISPSDETLSLYCEFPRRALDDWSFNPTCAPFFSGCAFFFLFLFSNFAVFPLFTLHVERLFDFTGHASSRGDLRAPRG